MTDLREAAQRALKTLEGINLLSMGENAICLPAEIDDVMDALRAALAEPVQPVAWAALVAAAEREECAKVVWSTPSPADEYVSLRDAIAAAIRSRT